MAVKKTTSRKKPTKATKVAKVSKSNKATKKNPAKKTVAKKKITKKESAIKRATKTKPALTKKEALEKAELLRSIITSEAMPKKKQVLRKKIHKIKLQTDKEAPLSPYTIFLSRDIPQPKKLFEEEAEMISLNFLNNWRLYDDPVVLESARNDLSISEEELLGQLNENDLTMPFAPIWSRFPTLPNFLKIQFKQEEPSVIDKPPQEKAIDLFETLDFPKDEVEDEGPIIALPEFIYDSRDDSPTIVEVEIEPEKRKKSGQTGPQAKPDMASHGGSAGKTKHRKKHGFIPPFNIRLEHGWHKAIASFVLLSFVFVLPLHAMGTFKNLQTTKAQIEDSNLAALESLQTAAGAVLSSNFAKAATDFSNASNEFQKAESTLSSLDATLRGIITLIPVTNKTYLSGTKLLKAGDSLSRAATRISDAFEAIQNEVNPSPVSKINILETTLTRTVPLIEEAAANLEGVNPEVIPKEALSAYNNLTMALPSLTSSLNEFLTFSDAAKEILGEKTKKRYLVIFQNNNELRPTGGFIGSFAEIEIYRGEITDIYIPAGGSYDLQGSNKKYIASPEPLQLINPRWEFQDANWFPDFPASANKLIDYYEHSGGPTIDGVIAVNATYVADLLNLLGPIDMPEYSRTIDGENFIFETQKIVEIESEKEAPKQFIADLAPKLLEQVKKAGARDFLSILAHLSTGLIEKDIQLYFSDHELEQEITDLGWGGEIKKIAGDYLMVVNTNIGGGKTDMIISEDIDLEVNISDDGTITNTVTINRTHHGIKNELFVGVNNVDFVRLYVPRGSRLIDASGFEIPEPELFERPPIEYEEDQDLSYTIANTFTDPASGTIISQEFGKTVFGNWIQTKPGETETATFTYELPWKIEMLSSTPSYFDRAKDALGFHPVETYTLFVQKQSGVVNQNFNIKINVPDILDIIWSTSEDAENNNININTTQNQEAFLGLVLEHDL